MGKKILLADDSLTIQKVVELTLSGTEYELTCVSNGQKALESIAQSRPDLILADAVMPEKNGYEVCEAVKGSRATARIPVVLLSGIFEPFDRERSERIGADLVVSKPFDAQQLLDQVESLLARAAAMPPASSEEDEPPFETWPVEEAAAGGGELAPEEPPPAPAHEIPETIPFVPDFAVAPEEEPLPPLPQPVPEGRGPRETIELVLDDISAEDADALFDIPGVRAQAPTLVSPPAVKPAPAPAPAAAPAPAQPPVPPATIALELTDEQIDRIAAAVVAKLSDRIVREIAWEVVPDMAEIAVKRRIAELESGTE